MQLITKQHFTALTAGFFLSNTTYSGICLFLVSTLLLHSCSGNYNEGKTAQVENECAAKTSINGLDISFNGYFTAEADSIFIRIKSTDNTSVSFVQPISGEIIDSSSHLRQYRLDHSLLLSDTLFLKIRSEPEKKVYGFSYAVKEHLRRIKNTWECDFSGMTIDGTKQEDTLVSFRKKGFNTVKRRDFGMYYGSE